MTHTVARRSPFLGIVRGGRKRHRWRRTIPVWDVAGSLGKPPRFGLLTTLGPDISVYDMETPPIRDSLHRSLSGALVDGLSGTLDVDEPAYPVYNTGAGEGWSPSIPPKSALTRISRPGASAPAFPVPTHPHG